MSRKLRIEYENAFYHIMSRGNTQSRIFQTDADRYKFLEYLIAIKEKYGIIIHAYCLMGNHYHLMLETPNANLVKAMHFLNSSYTTYYNRFHDRKGHLFSGRYKALLVEKDNYALLLSAYIHLNPVRAGMLELRDIGDYLWSSYNFYTFPEKYKNNDFVNTDTILSLLGETDSDEINMKYKKYVVSQYELDFDLKKEIKSDIILGSDSFYKWVKENAIINEWILNSDIPEFKNLFGTYEIEKIIRNLFKGNDFLTLSESYKRKIQIYLLNKYTDLKLQEIGEEFELTVSGVSKSCRRFSEELIKNEEIRGIMKLIEEKILKEEGKMSNFKVRPQC